MSDEKPRPRRNTEPVDRLGRLAEAMSDALQAHPESTEGDKAVVMLVAADGQALVHLIGYDSDTDAVIDMFVHLRAVMRANGKDLDLVVIPDDPSGLDR